MKKIIVSALMLGCSFSAAAQEDCSQTVKGYVAGLEMSTDIVGLGESDRMAVIDDIKQIKQWQKTYTACEIVKLVPALKESQDALDFVDDYMKKRG